MRGDSEIHIMQTGGHSTHQTILGYINAATVAKDRGGALPKTKERPRQWLEESSRGGQSYSLLSTETASHSQRRVVTPTGLEPVLPA